MTDCPSSQEQQEVAGASAAAAAAAGATPAAAERGGGSSSTVDTSTAPSTSGRPECYVIVYNISKHANVGTLLRSCTAFGVTAACLVGSRQFNSFGSHGACEHVRLIHFPSLEECCAYLKEVAGCRVLGVEIDASAAPIQSHPFCGPTAFMLGNEGSGLSTKQAGLCDGFVYIPQHGPGTASLNVTVAASIVLHHFAVWAGYAERERQGAKFVVADRPMRTAPRGVVPVTPHEQAAAALQRARLGLPAEDADGSGGGGGDAAAAAAAAAGEEWLAAAMAQHGGVEGLLEAVGGATAQ